MQLTALTLDNIQAIRIKSYFSWACCLFVIHYVPPDKQEALYGYTHLLTFRTTAASYPEYVRSPVNNTFITQIETAKNRYAQTMLFVLMSECGDTPFFLSDTDVSNVMECRFNSVVNIVFISIDNAKLRDFAVNCWYALLDTHLLIYKWE